jgi:hypothetical protein
MKKLLTLAFLLSASPALADALSTYWPTAIANSGCAAGATGTQCRIAWVNTQMVSGAYQNILVPSIVAYLVNVAHWPQVLSYGQLNYNKLLSGTAWASLTAAQQNGVQIYATTVVQSFTASFSTASNYSNIQAFFTTLSGDAASGLTAADVTAIMALASTTVPWWQANGYPFPINQGNVTNDGLQ